MQRASPHAQKSISHAQRVITHAQEPISHAQRAKPHVQEVISRAQRAMSHAQRASPHVQRPITRMQRAITCVQQALTHVQRPSDAAFAQRIGTKAGFEGSLMLFRIFPAPSFPKLPPLRLLLLSQLCPVSIEIRLMSPGERYGFPARVHSIAKIGHVNLQGGIRLHERDQVIQ